MPCSVCKLPYPEEILSPMFVGTPGGAGYTGLLCGICALEVTNSTHGTNRTKFTGEMAEEFRQRAIAWRKKHCN